VSILWRKPSLYAETKSRSAYGIWAVNDCRCVCEIVLHFCVCVVLCVCVRAARSFWLCKNYFFFFFYFLNFFFFPGQREFVSMLPLVCNEAVALLFMF